MYGDVYDAMVKAGMAEESDEWLYQDRQGNIVLEDHPERF
jgi:hypothetical protein